MRGNLSVIMITVFGSAAIFIAYCSSTKDMQVVGGWPGIDKSAMPTPSNSDELILPTTMCGHYFIAETYINGAGPFAMMLDTGNPRTLISSRVEDVAGLGSRITQITIGDLKLEGRVNFSVQEVNHLSHALGIHIDGILGHSVFRKVLLTYDFPGCELRVCIGRLKRDLPGIAPMSTGSRPYIGARVGETKINVLLDTGSSGGLSLLEFRNFSFVETPRTINASMRQNGLSLKHAGRLQDNVEFGSFTLSQPIVSNAIKRSLLGQRILREFVVTIDQQQGLVRIVRPNGTLQSEPIPMPSQYGPGWAILPERDRFTIRKVFSNSAAAAAGFQPDDIILAIEGVAVQDLGCLQDDTPVERPIHKIYRIERDGEIIELEMTTTILVQ